MQPATIPCPFQKIPDQNQADSGEQSRGCLPIFPGGIRQASPPVPHPEHPPVLPENQRPKHSVSSHAQRLFLRHLPESDQNPAETTFDLLMNRMVLRPRTPSSVLLKTDTLAERPAVDYFHSYEAGPTQNQPLLSKSRPIRLTFLFGEDSPDKRSPRHGFRLMESSSPRPLPFLCMHLTFQSVHPGC